MRSARASLPLLALSLAAAPLSAQGPEISLRLGVAGGPALCVPALVPGVEVRTPGALHAVAGVDAYLSRVAEHPHCGESVGGNVERYRRAETSPPRMRLGAEWDGAVGGVGASARAFVGQQGVVEGFSPLVGAGVSAGSGGWGVGLDGVVHRADVFEYVRDPRTGLQGEERALPRQWVPSVELSARYRVGRLWGGEGGAPGVGRPLVGGVLGGAAGAAAGFYAGILASGGCRGDDDGCVVAGMGGAILGEALGIPLGVHLAEGRRGSYPLAALASVGVAALGFAAMQVVGDSGPPAQGVWVLVPVAQLGSSIAVERRTRR